MIEACGLDAEEVFIGKVGLLNRNEKMEWLTPFLSAP
jgi:hypothetical protein